MADELDSEVERLVAAYGREGVLKAAMKPTIDDADCLTLVSNSGLHVPPREFIFGEQFNVTEGNIAFGDIDEFERILDNAMRRLREKIEEKRWKKVYLIPFGPVVLNMHIKMTVFRMLWIETIDIVYLGANQYALLERDTRASLTRGD